MIEDTSSLSPEEQEEQQGWWDTVADTVWNIEERHPTSPIETSSMRESRRVREMYEQEYDLLKRILSDAEDLKQKIWDFGMNGVTEEELVSPTFRDLNFRNYCKMREVKREFRELRTYLESYEDMVSNKEYYTSFHTSSVEP